MNYTICGYCGQSYSPYQGHACGAQQGPSTGGAALSGMSPNPVTYQMLRQEINDLRERLVQLEYKFHSQPLAVKGEE